jgi:hypothetical protein
MAPKEKQKIEIEKTHRDPLLSFNQAVTVDCSDFLGTALTRKRKAAARLRLPEFFLEGKDSIPERGLSQGANWDA